MVRIFWLWCLVFLIYNTVEVSSAESKEYFCNSSEVIVSSIVGSEARSKSDLQESLANGERDFYGKWSNFKVVAYSRVHASEEVAREWLGNDITFTDQRVNVDEDILEQPEYKETNISEADFFRLSGHVSFNKLGINEEFIKEVTVYDRETNCVWKSVWGRFYIKNSNTLLIHTEGVWFEVTKIKEQQKIW